MKRMVAAGTMISGTLVVEWEGDDAWPAGEVLAVVSAAVSAEKLPAPTDVAHQQGTREDAK